MHKLLLALACASPFAVSTEATAAQFDGSEVRAGAFVGARFQVSLGGKAEAKPRAGLAIAPTLNRAFGGRVDRTAIGQGIALNFGAKPTLTLGGVRADQALRLSPSTGPESKHKLGLSKGGWIAVGVGVVALAGGAYFLHVLDEAKDNTD
jgi:hypothetical protein